VLLADGTWGWPVEVFAVALGDETTVITTGTKSTFRAPYACTVVAVRACVSVASDALLTFDINEAASTILSTKITIDIGEKTSVTAATAAVLSDTTLADDAEITVDVDVAGTTGAGAKVVLYLQRTA
jgi:hypothetical protein